MTDSPRRRVFAALTPAELDLLAAGGVRRGPVHQVTDEIRRTHPTYDDEDCEYVAMLAAANGARGSAHRRVVAAADVATDPSDAAITLRDIVAFHVDEHPDGADEDLMWFDLTELEAVIALVSR